MTSPTGSGRAAMERTPAAMASTRAGSRARRSSRAPLRPASRPASRSRALASRISSVRSTRAAAMASSAASRAPEPRRARSRAAAWADRQISVTVRVATAMPTSLAEVPGHVPRPQLDQVAVRVVDVARAARARELRPAHVEPLGPQALHRRRVVGVLDAHGEVDVDAAAAAEQPDLRLPQPDASAVAGHDPVRIPVGPAVDDREAEDAGVEALGGLEVDDHEDELGD